MNQQDPSSETGAYYEAPPTIEAFAPNMAGVRQRKRRKSNAVVWIAVGGLGVLVALGIGYYVLNFTRDTFRTLSTFPAAEYMADYERILGTHFKASLSVEADLGGSLSEGRLFSFREENSQKTFAVLVPPEQNQMVFVKGQSYTAELEVGKGGIIYAKRFQKK